MELVRCDRCDKEFKKFDTPLHIGIRKQNTPLDFTGITTIKRDLCYDCYQDFKNWLDFKD